MTPDQAEAIGRYLKAQREKRGLSIRDLEQASGVANYLITRLELGQVTKPDTDKLVRLSRALGLSLTEVLEVGEVTTGTDLPTYGVYLRSRFTSLPEAEVERIERHFARVANKYGIDPNGPSAGEDERPEQPHRRGGGH